VQKAVLAITSGRERWLDFMVRNELKLERRSDPRGVGGLLARLVSGLG